jgi:WD40 repeat protein
LVRLWDVSRLVELRSWTFPGPAWCVAFTPDESALIAGCDDGTVRIIPLSPPSWLFNEKSWPEETMVTSLDGSAGAVFALAFSPDGKTLYAGTGSFADLTKPGRVLQWEVGTRKRGPDLGTTQGAVLALAATADRLASGGADQKVMLWDLAGATPPVTLSGQKVAIRGLAFLPDQRLLSAGGLPTDPQATGEIKIWDLGTRSEVPPLLGQRSGVSAVAASRDGAVVVTAGWDELVRVWRFAKTK